MDMETLGYLKSLFDTAGGLKSVGEALDIGKKAKELLRGSGAQPTAKEAELRQLILDLQDKMLDARQQTIELRLQLLTLVEERQRETSFETERGRYRLVELSRNSRAYVKEPDVPGAAIGPEYCAACFEQRRKLVMLQRVRATTGTDVLRCTECELQVFKPNGVERARLRISHNPLNRDW